MTSSVIESFQNIIALQSDDDKHRNVTRGRRAMRFRKAVFRKQAYVDQLETNLKHINFRTSWVDTALTEWQNRQNVDTIRPELTERTARDYIKYFIDRVHENVCTFMGLYGRFAGIILALRFSIGVVDDGIWHNENVKKIAKLGVPLVLFFGFLLYAVVVRIIITVKRQLFYFVWSVPSIGLMAITFCVILFLITKQSLGLCFHTQKQRKAAHAYKKLSHYITTTNKQPVINFHTKVKNYFSKCLPHKKQKTANDTSFVTILTAYFCHWLLLLAPLAYLSFFAITAHPLYGMFATIVIALIFSSDLSRVYVLPIVRLLSLALFVSIILLHTDLGFIIMESIIAKYLHLIDGVRSTLSVTLYSNEDAQFDSLFFNNIFQTFGLSGLIGMCYFLNLQIKLFPIVEHIGRNLTHTGVLMTFFVLLSPYCNICLFILLVEPYINALSLHEIFSFLLILQSYSSIPIVTSVYVTYGINVSILMVSSIISLLSCLIIAKIWRPEVNISANVDTLDNYLVKYKACKNWIDAFCNGAISAVKLNIVYFVSLVISYTISELIQKFCTFIHLLIECIWPTEYSRNYMMIIMAPLLMLTGLEFENSLLAGELMMKALMGDGSKAMQIFFEQHLTVRWLAECWMLNSGNQVYQLHDQVILAGVDGISYHYLHGTILNQLSESIIISLLLNSSNIAIQIFIAALTFSILEDRKEEIWDTYISVFISSVFANVLTGAIVGSVTRIQLIHCDEPKPNQCKELLNEFKKSGIGELAYLCRKSVKNNNYFLKGRYSLV